MCAVCDVLTDAALTALFRYTRTEHLSSTGGEPRAAGAGGAGTEDAGVALTVALQELAVNGNEAPGGGTLYNAIESPAAAVQR